MTSFQCVYINNSFIGMFGISFCGFTAWISCRGMLFLSKIYYQGTMLFWYGPMYFVAFPIVAFCFLPKLYSLKLTSIYEYLDIRFNFACRFLASITFCIQILLYISVALYAPALALSTIISIPLTVSIILTACLAALYVILGGAKASIYTSALQMILIITSMIVIFSVSLHQSGLHDVLKTAAAGGRLQLFDLRIDPRIRHSVWSLVIGGTGNILCLFAANQLTVQRYMAMGSLRSAQWVIILNIPFNFLILMTYIGAGLVMYRKYFGCNPLLQSKDQLLPRFVIDELSVIPGLVGLFAASVYSASLSTLSASYSALTAVFIEDVIKQFRIKIQKLGPMKPNICILLARYLRMFFMLFNLVLDLLSLYLKDISFMIFGIAGGPVLSAFSLGMFCPRIKGKAAFTAQLVSTVFCIFVAVGAVVSHVKPVALPVDNTCAESSSNMTFISKSEYGMVEPLHSDSWLIQLFRISYQYYSICSLVIAVVVAHVIQFSSGTFF
ncbi:unnamed protein product [Thelazia callipaeda]|uniref:Sodium/solute symporter n=1 Tax=Thelazia callipaeda TaxID=103827 RepID=A0A0N5DBT3_THECL|nr:unnamed protein product [Thelazia callipaeda]